MSIRPAIVIAAYNRPHSLSRLLSMVLTAEYPDAGGVSLVISIDGGGADEVIRIANEFEWLFGDKEVIAHSKNLGLREHILCCGDLSQKYGAIIMLEDDIVVSPAFYQYASELGGFYYDDAQVAQVSLYAYEYGELSLERFHPLNIGYDVFFMQWASSWGQLWTDRQWHAFREWYVGHSGDLVKKPKLPEYVRGWPASSWKKYYIAYLCDTDRYTVYPYCSYATPYGDSGENVKAGTLPVTQSPLAWGKLPALRLISSDLCYVKYDSYFQPTKTLIDSITDVFKNYDYVVDFQGHRPLGDIDIPYLLSVRDCMKPILSCGWNLYPFEINLIMQEAEEFSFGKTSDFCDQIPTWKRVRLVYWSKRVLGIPMSMFCSLVKMYFKIIK